MVKLSVSQAVPKCIPGFESRLGQFFCIFFLLAGQLFLLQIISIQVRQYLFIIQAIANSLSQ